MAATPAKYVRVLGLYPNQQGCAYAVLEGSSRLLSWGQLRLRRQSDDEFCRRLGRLLYRYAFQTIAFEAPNPRRSSTAQMRIRVAIDWSEQSELTVVRMSPSVAKGASGVDASARKRELVDHLIGRFPELAQCRPRTAVWIRDRRIDVFVAVGLCVGSAKKCA